MWHVTINTNHAANSAAEEQRLGDRLEWFVRNQLTRLENWRDLIHIEPSFDAVERVRIEGVGIERGSRRHMMHTHMVIIVEHRGKVSHIFRKRQLQNLVNQHLSEVRGSYVSTKLMSARALNYTTKTEGTAKEIKRLDDLNAVVF